MDYCGASMIRRQTPDQIYLLRKQRRSGEHVELYTYHLYCTKLKQLVGQAALDPFTRCEYHYVNTDSEEPYVQIQAKSSAEELTLAISYSQGVFSLRLAPMAGRPHGKLRSIGFEQQSDGSFVRELTREHIMAVITDLAEIVRLERLLGARSTGTESPPVS
jgi:hypothetical protein